MKRIITQDEFDSLIKYYGRGRNGCPYIDFGTDLSDCLFSELNIPKGTAFYGVILRGSVFANVNLEVCNFNKASMIGVIFKQVYCYCCSFTGSKMQGADFKASTFKGCNFGSAKLTNSKTKESDFSYSDFSTAIDPPDLPYICPPEGEFIAYKKACIRQFGVYDTHCIVTLRIPESAKRTSGTNRKCRCSEAIVERIETLAGEPLEQAYSAHDPLFTYEVGKTVRVDNFDENRWESCAPGIHFFIDKKEVKEYVI